MPTNMTWILVSDASRARLYASDSRERPLRLLQELEHPESRAANHELVSDRPGRVQQSAAPSRLGPNVGPAKGNRSAMEGHQTPKATEHQHFARQLADVLYKGMTDNAYARLVLVAPPQFLGLLREALEDSVHKRVKATLDKDYTQLSPQDLNERLRDALSDAA